VVVPAAKGWVAPSGGWSSKTMVITVVCSTQDGGACRIPQRVLCGGRVPPGPAATFHGILRESAAGRLALRPRVLTGSLRQSPPSTGVIVGNVSGGGGRPGGCDSLCECLGERKFEACVFCNGRLGAAVGTSCVSWLKRISFRTSKWEAPWRPTLEHCDDEHWGCAPEMACPG